MAHSTNLNIREQKGFTYIPVIIIGAGAAGISMGCRLKSELKFDQFRIFDRLSGIGGTWHINNYPGIVRFPTYKIRSIMTVTNVITSTKACDVPTILYSLSIKPNYASKTLFSTGPELVAYFHEVCEHFGITENFQLNSDVSELRWLDNEQLWEATVTRLVPGKGDLSASDRKRQAEQEGYHSVYLHTEKIRAKIVVSAVGGIVEPREFPIDVPGKEDFRGEVFHSSRWNYETGFDGKNVVVLGTGASAAQFVPLLVKEPYNARSVTQLMRSAPWVHPKEQEPGGKEKFAATAPRLLTRWPILGRMLRTIMFVVTEIEYMTAFSESNPQRAARNRRKMQEKYLEHLKQTAPQKYHDILTPDYEVGCKRRLFDAYWLESLHNPKITLKKKTLKSVQPNGVTLVPIEGQEEESIQKEIELIPADILILANGFDIGNWFHPMKVIGRDGHSIQDIWNERLGPQAYQGTAMDGFPNFFILFGPNTATGHSSVILAVENMVTYSLQFIRRILSGDVEVFEVKKHAEIDWTKKLQKEIQKSVFNRGGCTSWYIKDGWNSTAYP